MQEHVFITLPTGSDLQIAGATPFDLYAAARLLLDVLDIAATLTHNLRSQIEARQGLHVDRDLLFGPLAL